MSFTATATEKKATSIELVSGEEGEGILSLLAAEAESEGAADLPAGEGESEEGPAT